MTPKKTVELPIEESMRLEVMCKDLIDWLAAPDGSSEWGDAFTTAEEWAEWWENTGPRIAAVAYQGFHRLAWARTGAEVSENEREAVSDEALGLGRES